MLAWRVALKQERANRKHWFARCRRELAIDVDPIRLCWRSVTPWGTNLAWWLAHLDEAVTPIANPAEVAEFHWMSRDEIRGAEGMLPSLPPFVAAWESGEITLDG